MRCTCKDWKENIEKLIHPIAFLVARNPNIYKGYRGKIFIYCPWCAKKLIKDKEEE